MVRRGSTVRVRQRALQKRRTSALSRSGRLALHPACGGCGAVYGAFAFRTPLRSPWAPPLCPRSSYRRWRPWRKRASGACDALALGTGKETPMQLERIPDVAIPDKMADALAYWTRDALFSLGGSDETVTRIEIKPMPDGS